jgi:hypothetical protein
VCVCVFTRSDPWWRTKRRNWVLWKFWKIGIGSAFLCVFSVSLPLRGVCWDTLFSDRCIFRSLVYQRSLLDSLDSWSWKSRILETRRQRRYLIVLLRVIAVEKHRCKQAHLSDRSHFAREERTLPVFPLRAARQT